jgi:hypothetical protein
MSLMHILNPFKLATFRTFFDGAAHGRDEKTNEEAYTLFLSTPAKNYVAVTFSRKDAEQIASAFSDLIKAHDAQKENRN